MARFAVVGTGISGLGAAHLLHPSHEITVYEKAPRIGGHTRTLTVDYERCPIPVDTGFIVFNRPNYPHLTGLFAHLDVPVHKSDMSFAASIGGGWLEWGAKDLNAVLGQRRNLFRPRFALLVRDVLKFNAHAEAAIARHPEFTLAQLLAHLELGDWFRRFYLLPMAGAIWSCPLSEMMSFPASTLIRFFANHHLLSMTGQHQWYTVTGGAQEYVKRLVAPFTHRIRVNCGAAAILREGGKVHIHDTQGETSTYDGVVIACHGDEALNLLKDASSQERKALSPFRYQKNLAILHRDESVMPKRKRCWASWVYSSDGKVADPKITVSYWMNRLQGIDDRFPLFVSLNPKGKISSDRIFDIHEFDHPVFDRDVVAAQSLVRALQGVRNTWFCGAHLRYGFHEDGLSSAVDVARMTGCEVPWEVEYAAEQERPRAARSRAGAPAMVPVPVE
ncbi:MAG TPA: FAD-dependent oxidoreductase [Rhizomicrobium sp.]|jgi:predicted NAD/FAD-binding protein|nr:FAD-dependent oxidoreductase [Rhizomicrobium sp.]